MKTNLSWKDDTWANSICSVALLLLGMIAYWQFVNTPVGTSTWYLALSYVLMVLLLAIMWAVDYIWESNPVMESAALGNRKRFTYAILAGVILGVALQFNNLATVSSTNFFFVVLVAGWVEEAFFRGHIVPTAEKLLNALKFPFATPVAIIIGNGAFALFHYQAYNGSIAGMVAAFAFGIIATLGNTYFKSTGFGIGAHITNNLLIFMKV